MSTALNARWVENVERGLKDFQRATVDYVFRRMYRDDDCTRRFLVADEVGLGKTLVARGVIARTVRYLWEDIDRIDVVYICSNQDIARQNVRRLNVTGDRDFTLATRITYLPVEIQDLRDNKLNFVSFTPGTSFNLRSSMGRKWERVVLYWLLKEAWGFRRTAPLNVLQGRVTDHRAFRESVGWFRRRKRIDRGLKEGFLDEIERRSRQERAEGRPDLRERFEWLYDAFGYARDPGRYPARARRLRREVIGELRWTLAVACVKALEPDLVILDEFQRFKDLLLGDDAASLLARELFEYTDEVAEARVLLLSATPYKMYTIADEHAYDHHYQDFVDTLRFLYDDHAATAEMERLLNDYRRELFRLGRGGLARLRELKSEIERRLRRVMVRTERLAASPDRSGMLAEISVGRMELRPPDVHTFLELQKLARQVGYGDTLPFWKSTPYALSFMEGYKLTERFEEAVSDEGSSRAVARLLRSSNGLSLSWSDIRRYREVDPGNARLRVLFADVIERGAWRLLWVPPSLPYYQPAAPFADPELRGLTKRLVFSAWRVVPKVVATLLSYEAERRLMRSFEEEPENTSEARKRRRPLLMFTLSDDRLTGMPVLGILYPSAVLAERLDPLLVARGLATGGELLSSDEVLEAATATAADLLAPLVAGAPAEGPEDETWYWAAPILLDLHQREEAALAWLRRRNLAAKWQGAGSSEEDVGRWGDHVELAQTLLEGGLELGRPPEDLDRVVALIGLAGPAVTALRALRRLGGPGVLDDSEARDAAGQIAWAFRHLFNLPEAMALIRGLDAREPYWQRVLEYSLAGNLQATLDEFAHMLCESLGFTGQDVADPTVLIHAVSEAIREALTLRTVSLGVDDVRVDGSDAVQIERRRLRAHFAMRFGDESGTEEQAGARASQVRAAFNSPFWPFVLATTSVGQEGLDFHTYCHAVVHWNLPLNPVDLEQREGRVHRYKGHAVRRNVARRHGAEVLGGAAVSAGAPSTQRSGTVNPRVNPSDSLGEAPPSAGKPPPGDPWAALFAAGEETRAPDQSELVPFWIYPVEDGARIERHVPVLPLSRDQAHLAALKRSLAVYRMVFGQPRQEDLLEFLIRVLPEEEVEKVVEELRIDLSPPPETMEFQDAAEVSARNE